MLRDIGKLLKTKNREKNLKGNQKEITHTHRGRTIQMTEIFSNDRISDQIQEGQKDMEQQFQML